MTITATIKGVVTGLVGRDEPQNHFHLPICLITCSPSSYIFLVLLHLTATCKSYTYSVSSYKKAPLLPLALPPLHSMPASSRKHTLSALLWKPSVQPACADISVYGPVLGHLLITPAGQGLCEEESGLGLLCAATLCPMWSGKVYWWKRTPGRDNLSWEMYLHRDWVAPAVPVPTRGEFGGSESTRWEGADPWE